MGKLWLQFRIQHDYIAYKCSWNLIRKLCWCLRNHQPKKKKRRTMSKLQHRCQVPNVFEKLIGITMHLFYIFYLKQKKSIDSAVFNINAPYMLVWEKRNFWEVKPSLCFQCSMRTEHMLFLERDSPHSLVKNCDQHFTEVEYQSIAKIRNGWIRWAQTRYHGKNLFCLLQMCFTSATFSYRWCRHTFLFSMRQKVAQNSAGWII